MNLVKNGAVLLAALSTFAITSCGPKTKTLTKEEAREFLKDAEKREDVAKKYIVKNEEFSWNCTVTGTGMKPGEKDGGKYGPVQFMLAYLVNDSFMKDVSGMDAFLKNFANLHDNYTSKINESTEPGINDTLSYIDQDGFDTIVGTVKNKSPWGDNFKFTVSQNLLHIKFDRTEELPDPKKTEITFIQDIVVAKDGFVKYYEIDLNKLEIDLDIEMGDPFLKAKGTADGKVKCVTTLEEIDK